MIIRKFGIAIALSTVVSLSAFAMFSFEVHNGSFEVDPQNAYPSSVTDWNLGGFRSVGVELMASYYPSPAPDGTKILTFNNGQRSSGSSIQQTLTTEAGKTYELRFLYGNFGYNPCVQILNLRIDDVQNSTNLVTQSFVDATQADPRVDPFGLTLWNDTAVRFQATSNQISIQMSDDGSDTDATDLLLDNIRIVEIDTLAPAITAAASETLLWPPNGKNHAVAITGSTSDAESGIAGATWTLTDSYGQLSGNGALPVGGAFTINLNLPAYRRGSDLDGRTYTVTIVATDAAGNTARKRVVITVPHDQGH